MGKITKVGHVRFADDLEYDRDSIKARDKYFAYQEFSTMKQKPTGFVAICQCGNIVGAMDYERTEREDPYGELDVSGQILGQWIEDGCIIQPRFEEIWSVSISTCECHNDE